MQNPRKCCGSIKSSDIFVSVEFSKDTLLHGIVNVCAKGSNYEIRSHFEVLQHTGPADFVTAVRSLCAAPTVRCAELSVVNVAFNLIS